jgi:hypothetical protein
MAGPISINEAPLSRVDLEDGVVDVLSLPPREQGCHGFVHRSAEAEPRPRVPSGSQYMSTPNLEAPLSAAALVILAPSVPQSRP